MKLLYRAVLAVCSFALVLAMTPGFSPAAAAEGADGKIVILHTNDVHCSVDYSAEEGIAGYAGLAAVYKEQQAVYGSDNVTLVDSGDSVQGGTLGTLTKGESIITLMNAVGYSCAALGNHEFDYGINQLSALASKAKHSYVSCNFVYLTGEKAGTTVYEPYYLKSFQTSAGTKTVAFVGITSPETLTSDNPSGYYDKDGTQLYGFCEDATGEKLYSCVQQTVNEAREKADYVVALGHMGQASSAARWRSDTLISKTSGIDVFLDAHSHQTYSEGPDAQITVKNKNGEDVYIAQTGTKLQNIGKVTIDVAANTISLENISASSIAAPDEEVASVVEAEKEKFKEITSKKVGYTSVDLRAKNDDGSWLVRSHESNLGDLVADSFRSLLGCDIGIVNGGGVRDNIAAGDITYSEMLNVQPFGNDICSIQATGQQIADALELSVSSLPGLFGGFLQVSGLTFDIDLDVPSAVKVDGNSQFVSVEGARRVKNIRVGGKPLDLNATYSLASSTYILLESGNGYSMFKDCVVLNHSGLQDIDAFARYLEQLDGVVGPEYGNVMGSGRIGYCSNIELKDGSFTYNGKIQAIPAAKVSGSTGAVTYAYYSDAACTKAVGVPCNAGTYYVKATVAAQGDYRSATSNTAKLVIKKAAQTVKVIAKSKSAKAGKKTKAVKASGAKGAVSFYKKSGSKYLSVTKGGKIKVSKKAKSGKTYRIKVYAKAKGTSNYQSGKSKAVTIVVKVK